MNLETVNRAVRRVVIILAFSFSFSSIFFFMFQEPDNSILFRLIAIFTNIIFMVIPAIIVYYRHISLRTIYSVMMFLAILSRLISPASDGFSIFVYHFFAGGVVCLSILVTGTALSFSTKKRVKSNVFVGIALAAIFVLLFHLLTPLDDVQIQQLTFVLFLVSVTVLMLIEKGTADLFPSVKEVTDKYRSKTNRFIPLRAVKQKTSLILLIFAALFSFYYGLFGTYSLIKGAEFDFTYEMMLAIFILAIAFLILNKFKSIEKWFNTFFMIFSLASIVSLFFVSASDNLPPFFLALLGTAIIILLIPILIFFTESAIDKSISPIFTYGVTACALFTILELSRLAALLFVSLFGVQAFDVSIFGAGALALFAITASGLLHVFVSKEVKTLKPDEIESTSENLLGSKSYGENRFLQVCDHYGLTTRERQIAQLYSQGRSVPHIVSVCFISESTVKSHLKRIYTKLEINNKQELLDIIAGDDKWVSKNEGLP